MFHKAAFILVVLIGALTAHDSRADAAKTIDGLVDRLAQGIINADDSEFAQNVTDIMKNDDRYKNNDFDKLHKSTEQSVAPLFQMGKVISHSRVDRRLCGDRLARAISLFYAEEGQYFVVYWFMRSGEKWSLANFRFSGHSDPGPMLDELNQILSLSCS